jgi:hypothetical protein
VTARKGVTRSGVPPPEATLSLRLLDLLSRDFKLSLRAAECDPADDDRPER